MQTSTSTSEFVKRLQLYPGQRIAKLTREFGWVAAGQGLAMVGSLVGVKVLTGILPPAVYGQLALAMTIAMLVNQVVAGPIAQASLRFLSAARETGAFRPYAKALRQLSIWLTFVIIFMGASICVVLSLSRFNTWIFLAAAASGYALVWAWNTVLDGLQNAARHRSVVAWHQAASTWSRFLLAWVLLAAVGGSSSLAMLGYVFGAILVLLSQLWFFKLRFKEPLGVANLEGSGDSVHWRSVMLTYAWPFACWGILTWFKIASDRWALQLFSSTDDVGIYTVLYQLGYAPVLLLTGMIVQLAAPVFFERAGSGQNPSKMWNVYLLNWRLTKYLLTGSLGVFALIFGFRDAIFGILVDQAYHSGAWLLPFMVLASSTFAVAQFALISLLSETRSSTLLLPKVATALLGGILNFVGAAWYGVAGVVGANVAFSLVYLFWIAGLVRLRMRNFAFETGGRNSPQQVIP